jgi:hypothetical protein
MPLSLRSRCFAFAASVAVLLTFARSTRAEPWFGWSDARLEDRYADGDFDEEDVAAMRLGRGHVGASDLRGRSWFTIKGFYAERNSGLRELGVIAVLGLALDKITAGPVHRTRDALHNFADGTAPRPPPTAAPTPPTPRLVVTPTLARSCVAAAWRASGLGVDDARIDAIVARARMSAALPETRLRAMRLVNETARTDTSSPTYYDATGANLWLEARFTWRLDRLIYADDEPTLERVRLERHDARTRLSARVLEALFAWQRAWLERGASTEGSLEHLEATVRMAEAETSLDVLTAGWFGAWRVTQTSLAPH